MRLTDKTEHGSYWTKVSKGVRETLLFKEEITKLGQLEDIEEELGVDLVTLFKALKNGIKAKWNEQVVDLTILGGCQLWFNRKCFQLIDYNGSEWFYYFKDYGKTWALTKEELL